MNKYIKSLDLITKSADKQADDLIAHVRTVLLIPYCDRTGFRFTSGNGDWFFDKKGATYAGWDIHAPPPRIPKTLYDFLKSPYPTSVQYNDCGSMMLDYTPPNWKDKP